VLEWTWFLNSFSKGHLYEFMYGDKDTYGLAFALANKAHMYQHVNMPPGKTTAPPITTKYCGPASTVERWLACS
jgi:hypothetical protein